MAMSEAVPLEAQRRRRNAVSVARWAARFVRRKPLGAVGGAILLLVIVVAIAAPYIAPSDPLALRAAHRFEPPGAGFLLGTDKFGRDILSRVIFGARISLWVGIVSVGIGAGLGSVIGVISGYAGGRADLLVQRAMDAILAFPTLILAITITAALGISTTNTMLAIGIVMIPQVSRVVRSTTLAVKGNQFIEAARAVGCGHLRIVLQHVAPNVAAPVIIIATGGLGSAILTEASLSFLGLGTPPPTASWGADLSGLGREYFERAPWMAIFPGVAITLVVLGFNLLGDALRDIMDPRLRGR